MHVLVYLPFLILVAYYQRMRMIQKGMFVNTFPSILFRSNGGCHRVLQEGFLRRTVTTTTVTVVREEEKMGS